MKKEIVGLSIFVLLMVFVTISYADTIYLKDGKTVTGEIIEEDSVKVKIKSGKFPRFYYRHEIERIDRDETPEDSAGDSARRVGVDGISEEDRMLILRLFDANGIRESVVMMFHQIIRDLPQEAQEEFKKIIKAEELLEQLVAIYAKHYTTEEIKVLLEFYSSPTGNKHVRLAPKIIEETMTTMAEYFSKNIQPKDPIFQP